MTKHVFAAASLSEMATLAAALTAAITEAPEARRTFDSMNATLMDKRSDATDGEPDELWTTESASSAELVWMLSLL